MRVHSRTHLPVADTVATELALSSTVVQENQAIAGDRNTQMHGQVADTTCTTLNCISLLTLLF